MIKQSILTLGLLALAAGTAQAATISIGYSESFQEKLEDDLGEREGERLKEYVTQSLERAFEKRGVDAARLDVTIEDAKPNRPTFEQLSQRPGLDFGRSISIGGADFTAVAYDEAGNVLAEVDYDWFENDLRDVIGSGTWSDARRATRQFANRMAKSLDTQ
ncbi:MAG: hypothetical protein AAF253_02815 [Pseudomonadota bacterium]